METKKGRRRTTTVIEDLSDDLTVQILLSLPTCSRIRCYDVCKRWRSLLTDNQFFPTHTINVVETYNGHEKYMFQERGQGGGMQQISELDFSFHFPNKKRYKRRILTCCNGLLFSAYFIGSRYDLTQCFISNPLTKECIRLPKTTHGLSKDSHFGLAFENNSSGNNNSAASYKVVIPNSVFFPYNQFDVYSSDKKRWQRLRLGKSSKPLPHCNCQLDRIGVYCNRVLYWKCSIKWRGKEQHALMFNVETETPGYLYLPSDNNDDESILPGKESGYLSDGKLTEYDGQLHYIRIILLCGRLIIWKMSTSGRWLVLHNVDFKGAVESNPSFFPLLGQGIGFAFIDAIGMSLEGDDKVLLKYVHRRIVSYDLKKGVFELLLQNEPQDRRIMWRLFRYIPTTKFISEKKYNWCLSKRKYMCKDISTSTPNYATQRPKAYWSPQRHQKFVELCVEQVHKGNRPTRCFNRAGWEAIIEGFTQTTGLHYDQKQMKNHYDSTKRLWKAWKVLIGNSNMGFDPILRTITAPDEAWAAYILANPRAAKLRNRPLKFEDQLDIIFGRTAMTADNALAPSSSVLHNNVVNITQGSQDPVSIQIGTPERHSQCLEEAPTSPSMAHHEVDMVDNNHRKSNLVRVMKRSMEPTSSSSRKSKRVAEGGTKMAD